MCSSTTNLKTLPAAVSSIRSDTFLPRVKKNWWKASPPPCIGLRAARKQSWVGRGGKLLSPSPRALWEAGGKLWGFFWESSPFFSRKEGRGEPSVGLFLKHTHALRQGLEEFAGLCQGYVRDPQSQKCIVSTTSILIVS